MSRRAAALTALLLALAAPLRAATAEVAVDPRFELLGVVRQLAGLGSAGRGVEEYRARVEKRFGPFRSHPAVALYKDAAASPAGEEATTTILLYFSAPPELRLLDRDADIHYLAADGAREEMHRLLWELRDFAKASSFMAFFKESAPYYRTIEEPARAAIAAADPVPSIEKLLGVSLSSRAHYILPLNAPGTRAFILPYPLPPGAAGAKSFDVYTVSGDRLANGHADVYEEALYVFVDPSLYYFERLNVPDPVAFYGPEVARCHAVSPDCVKQFVVPALIERLKRRPGEPARPLVRERYASDLEFRYARALSERLDEYERDRARYPTLWSFYPRLFSVFHELAHGGKPAALSVPADPPIRAAADFFDPAVFKRLSR